MHISFASLHYFGVPNKALFFPYNKQTSSFGLFHIYAWVHVVPCIKVRLSKLQVQQHKREQRFLKGPFSC